MFVRPPRRPPPRRGSVLPVVTISLVVLVGMVAFAIDTGQVAHARTGLQAAADAGALAGLAQLQSGAKARQDFDAARAEVNKYVGGAAGNFPGLAVNAADIEFGIFDPAAAPGARFTTTLNNRPANALRVTLRRDGRTNPRLPLSFSTLLGKSDGAVTARATAWASPITGVRPQAPVIPYAAQVDYFNAAAGLPARPKDSPGYVNVNPNQFGDNWSIGNVGTIPRAAPDGVREIVLFGSTQNAPGNFGSVDLGGDSNSASTLERQLVDGPSAADFAALGAQGKLATDGALQAPVALQGDTGLSNGTQDSWRSIIGQNRIIPLYSSVSGTGNTAVYNIVGFAGVRIVDVRLNGNPKKVWVQTTAIYSSRVQAATSGSPVSIGVYAPPRLVIP